MDFSIAEIAEAVKGEIYNNTDKNIRIKNIATDSRGIFPDSLFFAIKGEKFDGHDFILNAFKNGALGVVARKSWVKQFALPDEAATIVAVDDTVQALLDFSKRYKQSCKGLILTVAVTGSVGKTTVKEFVYSVLSEKFKTKKTVGNLNTEIGLPYTLFSLEKDTEAVVLEMGMSGFGEIKRLSEAANPDTAVINNIGTSHIEMLGSREGIKKAKFEILDGMDLNSNIILNADEPLLYCEKNKTGRKEYFFGIDNKEADFIAENIEFDYIENISVFEADKCKYKIPAAGIHNVSNALPALIAGKIYGLSDGEIQEGFNNFENVKMRQNIYRFHDITLIDDCYNASEESVLAAFNVLAGIAAQKKANGNTRKIAVLSDILESGGYSNQIHSNIGDAAVNKNIDIVYLFGEKSKATYETIKRHDKIECVYFDDKSEIAQVLYNRAKKGDVILFKASRGMALETVIEEFKNKY